MNTIEVLKEMLRVMNLVGMLGYDEDRIAALTEAIEQLEWIPISERLPEVNQQVLIFDDCFNVRCGDWLGDKFEDEYGYHATDVTHWMPLPEPPKGE